MNAKLYTGPAVFLMLMLAAFIVGITTGNKFVLLVGYIAIVMAQVSYLLGYMKIIKEDIENIKELLSKK